MSLSNLASRFRSTHRWTRWTAECLFGFLYWLAFLLVLEPDNILRSQQAGGALSFPIEALRILVAALLGASATPVLRSLTRRFPMEGSAALRHGFARCLGVLWLAFGLILASCFLVAWGFAHEWLPRYGDLREQLVANGTLLVFALAALDVLAHQVGRYGRVADASGAAAADYPVRIPIKERGRQSFLPLDQVDWIETQGNYVALHVGERSHLIRTTLNQFETTLDPALFVRIHRRTIVPVQGVRALQPLTNGDALLRMASGQELRVSRSYRPLIAQRWEGRPARSASEAIAPA